MWGYASGTFYSMDVRLSLVTGDGTGCISCRRCGTLQYHYTAMFPQVGWYRMCILFELCVRGDVPCSMEILLCLPMVDDTGHVSC